MPALTKDSALGGAGATLVLGTDRFAYTIIAVTNNTVTLQRDKATRITTPEIIPGGFAGHCANNDAIEYSYERDPDGETVKCHWSNKLSRFVCQGYTSVIAGRHEKYDYNF